MTIWLDRDHGSSKMRASACASRSMGAERLNDILRKNAFRRKLVDASCLVASDVHRVTMDVMFELFDNELLITNNAIHHVANRNYADQSSTFEHREMAHCFCGHYGHAFLH